jgi:hypothetical protein
MALQETKTSKKGYAGRKPKGKTVYAHMGIWRDGENIHITAPKEKYLHTTVNSNPGSERCHKNLYGKLRRLLEENGCWE